MENSMIIKNLLSAANQYDLVAEDEIEIKINGTVVLKEQVPNGEEWLTHISINVEARKLE